MREKLLGESAVSFLCIPARLEGLMKEFAVRGRICERSFWERVCLYKQCAFVLQSFDASFSKGLSINNLGCSIGTVSEQISNA